MKLFSLIILLSIAQAIQSGNLDLCFNIRINFLINLFFSYPSSTNLFDWRTSTRWLHSISSSRIRRCSWYRSWTFCTRQYTIQTTPSCLTASRCSGTSEIYSTCCTTRSSQIQQILCFIDVFYFIFQYRIFLI